MKTKHIIVTFVPASPEQHVVLHRAPDGVEVCAATKRPRASFVVTVSRQSGTT